MSWLFIDRLVHIVLGLLVGVWVARYLGPEDYGLLNYCISLISLIGVLASLGLKQIVLRDLINEPNNAGGVLATAVYLRFFGVFLAVPFLAIGLVYLTPDDGPARSIIFILYLRLLFQTTDILSCWFEARVESRYVVWVKTSIFIFVSSVRIVMILYGASIYAFAVALFLESVLVSLGYVAVYLRRACTVEDWQFELQRARQLLKDSWPLLLSGVAIMVYMRIDQIMLGRMVDDTAVGIYAAALRISELWYMVPAIVVASVFPGVQEVRTKNLTEYHEQIQKLLNALAAFSLLVCVVTSFAAEWIIWLLFGAPFAAAATVLQIHVWAGLFVFLGVAGNKWYVTENLQRFVFWRTLTGAVVNVILNLIFIPRWGAPGAAMATVISQALSAYILDAQSSATLVLFKFKTRALFFGLFRRN